MYRTYFGVKLKGQDKGFAYHLQKLQLWVSISGMYKRWKIPVFFLWFGENRQTTATECYFCAVKTVGVTSKNKYLIKYPNLCRNSSAGVWRIFSETLDLVSVFKESFYDTSTPDVDVNMELGFDSADPALSSSWHSVKFNPEVFNQKELNDLILDINVSEENSKLLASRTQGKTFLALAQK